MPQWVNAGYEDYARRLPPECRLELVAIPPGPRGRGGDVARARAREGERMLAAIPARAHVVALEVEGRPWTTPDLARSLEAWLQQGRDVALLVGGPDGLDECCRARADEARSLSPLTLPHGLVRVLVAEQIYRAWSLLRGHPYHRA